MNAYNIIVNKLEFPNPVAFIASIDGCVYVQGQFSLIRAQVTWMNSLKGKAYDTSIFFVPNDNQWDYRLLGANEVVSNEMLAARPQIWFDAFSGTGRASQSFREIKFDLVNHPAPYPSEALGSLDYYRFRYVDFVRKNPNREPPDYYLEFGEKYLHRFMKETRQKLTPQGQQFVDKVGRNLQVMMEHLLTSNPERFADLERKQHTFRQIAYLTHIKAYCNAGWENLSQIDRDTIIGDVDLGDKYDLRQFGGIYSGTVITFDCGSWRDLLPTTLPQFYNSWNDLIDLLFMWN